MTGRTLLWVAVASSSGAGPAGAQEVLTLDCAVEIAVDRNPDVLRARARERGAEAERRARWGRLLPTATLTSRFDVTRTRSFTATDEFGDPTAREDAVDVTTRGSDQGITIGWTLHDGGRDVFGAAAAGRRVEAARAETAARRVEVRAEVTRRYVDLLEARATIETESSILDARRRDVEATEASFRLAAADRIDVLGARIEAARQEARLAEAIGRARRSEFELARAIGIGGRIEARLVQPAEPFDPAGLDGEALLRSSIGLHPGLRRRAAEVDAARIEARGLAWWARLPRIRADASFRRSEFGDRGTPFFNLDPANSTWRFGLSLSLPLFDGLERRASRARAEVVRRIAEEDRRARRREFEAAVEGRWLDLGTAYRRLAVEREAAGLARERAGLTRRKHRIGAVDFTRLQQVVDQANAAERRAVSRRFEYDRTLAELERALGRRVRTDGTSPGPGRRTREGRSGTCEPWRGRS